MYPNRPDLLAEARSHFNEPVIHLLSVARCIGYGEDADDCYFILRRPDPHADELWASCCGGTTFLNSLDKQNYVISIDYREWDDLIRLDNTLALNGAPKANELVVKLNHHVSWLETDDDK